MMLLIRVLCLAGVVVALAQCSGGGARGCSQIAEKSSGPCRVGLSPKSYYDSSWKSQ